MVKKALFATMASYSEFLNGEIDGISFLNKEKYKIEVATCGGFVSSCSFNLKASKLECYKCRLFKNVVMSNLTKEIPLTLVKFHKSTVTWKKEFETLGFHENLSQEQLENIKYENFDIGWSIVSRGFDLTNSDILDIKSIFPKLRSYAFSIFCTYKSLIELIEKRKPDVVVFFSSRIGEYRAFKSACEFSKVNFLTIDKFTFASDRWRFHENHWPYDYDSVGFQMIDYWNKNASDSLSSLCDGWFQRRRLGCVDNDINYNKYQKAGLGLNIKGKQIVSIFLSTWREGGGISQNHLPYFGRNQLESLKQIIKYWPIDLKDHQIVIRCHPNQVTALDEIEKLKNFFDNHRDIIFVEPLNTIDSYELIDLSKCVLSFGSTIGVEACYWERPSGLLCCSNFVGIDVATVCDSFDKLWGFIRSPSLKRKENAFKHAAYYCSFGNPSVNYLRKFDFIQKLIYIKKSHLAHSLFSKGGYIVRSITGSNSCA
jgi:hypothetical protein